MRYFFFPQPATRMALLWCLLLCLWAGQQNAQAFVITTQAVQGGTSFCAGGPLRVPYAVDQPFNSGNVFTAQLSDDAGSFAAPVNIGSLAGTSNGLIQTIIPAATAAGSGYRVRVVSSNPVVTGTDNGTDLTVVNLGPLTAGANTPLCVGDNLLLTASLVPGASYFWTGTVTVNPAATVALTPFAASVCNNGPLLTLSGGSPAGGVYSGPGVVNGVFNPATVGAGTYTITYTTTTAAGCAAAATQPLSVTACTPTATASGAPAVGLTLHPNPSSGRVVLTLTGTVRPQHAPQVVVLNVLGQEVNRATLSVTGAGSLAHALDLHEYADGVYLLRLDPGNGQWLTRRLVLRH